MVKTQVQGKIPEHMTNQITNKNVMTPEVKQFLDWGVNKKLHEKRRKLGCPGYEKPWDVPEPKPEGNDDRSGSELIAETN